MNKKGFRYFCFIVLCIAVFPLCFMFAPAKTVSAEGFDIYSCVQENVLTSIEGDFGNAKIKDQEDAFELLDALKDEFGFTSSKETFEFVKTNNSIVGKVYKFYQIVDNLQVYGGEINISTLNSNKVSGITGKYFLDVEYDNTINFTQEEAFEVVKNSYSSIATIEFEEIYIYDFDDYGYIAYEFTVSTIGEGYTVFVSAKSGEITNEISKGTSLRSSLDGLFQQVESHTFVIEGTDYTVDVAKYRGTNGVYYALSNPQKRIYTTDGQNSDNYSYSYYDDNTLTFSFGDDDAIKAYYSILKCYEFYADESNFGIAQEGIKNDNGQSIDLIVIVHFGSKYENAGYLAPGTSQKGYFIFGDGNSENGTISFVNGVDIVGHEYQHAYTSQICDFVYSGESGALAEAFSDMFGAVIEGKGVSNHDFWIMGEDVVLNKSKIFRDMSNPSSTGCAYDYSSYSQNLALCGGKYTDDNDYGRIHTNCTLPTYATYLMYQSNPSFFTEYRILQLWYQTLTKLTTTSGIIDFCNAMVASVDEMYQAGLTEYTPEIRRVIEGVFASLGVPGFTGIEIWNNNSLSVLQGEGTISSPYLINSVVDLASLAYYVNNGEGSYATARYKLTTDLEISANIDWCAIGTLTNQFNGYFNGNSHTITYKINVQDSKFAGIFGYCGASAFIYDLYVEGNSVQTTSEYAGAIVCSLSGTLSGCSSSMNITGVNVGGLVGVINNQDSDQKIINCFSTATLVGDEVGGLVCHFNTEKNSEFKTYESGVIISSYFSGEIRANVAGGIVARANGVYLINNIVNAKITATNASLSIVGGLVGVLQLSQVLSTKTVTNSRNYVLYNRIVLDVSNVENIAGSGLISGSISGELGEGFYYIAGNVAKSVAGSQLYNKDVAQSIFVDDGSKISTDEVFADDGDFDFDNEEFYNSSNWFTIQGTTAFDMTTTFKVKNRQMPQFREIEFWLDSAIYNFAGSGTESDPYQISNAKQLAGLAGLVASDLYHNEYASKHYVLTKDIDLSGKVWAGIGIVKYVYSNNTFMSATVYGFSGTFDGNGHTISNMNTLGLYSIAKTTADGKSYCLYEYNPGLFGVTITNEERVLFVSNKTTVKSVPTIKNLTIEDAIVTGSNAGTVVSKAFTAINLDNVTAMNATVSSNSTAGGLIGTIQGIGGNYDSDIQSTISNCYVLGSISGVVVGGAVGEVSDASASNGSNIMIINFLLRGTINVLGTDHDAEYDYITETATYYNPIAGSIVGVTTAESLQIINCISMANIVSYIQGANLGGFVGCVGTGDIYLKTGLTISVDGSKFVGSMTDVFNKNTSYAGSIIGVTYDLLNASLTLNVSQTTVTNVNSSAIYRNGLSRVSGSQENQYSEDQVGEGDFDLYNNDYYANADNFNLDYKWTESQTSRLYFTVVFYNDGQIYGQIYTLKENQTISAPEDPTKESTAQYDFVFTGWDQDFSKITKNMKINAKYDKIVRSYLVTFVDEDGNEVDSKTLQYGASVNQNVEAPEKKGNLFIKYEFVRWGGTNQTVTGEMQVSAVYEVKLTKLSSGLIVIAVFTIFVLLVVFVKKKSKV